MKARLQRLLEHAWYQPSAWTLPLVPLSGLTALVARRRLARHRRLRQNPPVPVIVVGNITVGGTGKTPLVAALVAEAYARGYRPAVISRGYRAHPPAFPWTVDVDNAADIAGDEPLLLARETGAPVIIDPDRQRAMRHAIAAHGADLIISDDGLQHYRLPRSFEIAVIDGQRGLGNGRCLPAGPLREPADRLADVDMCVSNGKLESRPASDLPDSIVMTLQPGEPRRVSDDQGMPLADFLRAYPRVVGAAGIGHPGRFFHTLRECGFEVMERPFPDHHAYTAQDLELSGEAALLMTAKDAVKCRSFANDQHWYLPVTARLPGGAMDRIFAEAVK